MKKRETIKIIDSEKGIGLSCLGFVSAEKLMPLNKLCRICKLDVPKKDAELCEYCYRIINNNGENTRNKRKSTRRRK